MNSSFNVFHNNLYHPFLKESNLGDDRKYFLTVFLSIEKERKNFIRWLEEKNLFVKEWWNDNESTRTNKNEGNY